MAVLDILKKYKSKYDCEIDIDKRIIYKSIIEDLEELLDDGK